MSDKTSASRPSRGGSGLILSGLAVGAILGTPVPAAAVTAAYSAATVRGQQVVAAESPVAAIREQFRSSFTAGAVIPPASEIVPIICDPN